MKSPISRAAILAFAPLFFCCQKAVYAQLPTTYYNFEGGNLNNSGTLGGAGTSVNFTGNEFVSGAPGGSTSGGGLKLDADGAADGGTGKYFQTGLGAGPIGFDAAPYTASAWVKFDSVSGDNMVFGQTGGNLLHDGVRDGQVHMGHWGQDTTSAAIVNTGTWDHYAWTQLTAANFGAGGTGNAQFLYKNGFIVAASGSGPLGNNGNVVIGSSGNGGGLLGTLDDVATYNSSLRPNQVQYLAGGGSPLTLPAGTGYLGATLPGAEGTVGNFSVTEVRTNAALNMAHIDAAVGALQPGNPSVIQTATASRPSINFTDPDTNAGGGGVVSGDLPYLTNTVGVDDDRLAFVAKGTINIPTAGTYNFTAHGDDGFGLRIRGQNWSSVSGGGGIDPRDSQTIYYAGGTGDSNTTGSVTLPAGNYQLEYVGFEGGGGANQELTVSTPGGLASLVGTPAAVVHNAGVTSAGWTVTTSAPGGTGVGNIAAARADLANFPAGSASNVTSINYSDPDNNGGGGGILGDVAFPNDIAGADDNDFSLLSTAQIVIPIAGNYRFGFRGDDGGYLRIAGVSGWSIVENATGLAQITDVNGVANPLGDTLWTDAATGNSTTVGQIALAAGTYNIEGLFFEISGGGNFEIFSSEAITGVENGYQLLAIGGDLVTRSTAGVTLVPEPTSLAMMVLGGSFLLRRRRRNA